MRVDQLVPAFHRGDAIGDTAFHMKEFFLSQGFQSEIYCLTRDLGLEDACELFSAYSNADPSDVTILHYALPSPLTAAFAKLPSRKVILYHNLTPHEFFEGFSLEMARISRLGREELKSLVPYVSLALADSEFNRQELVRVGYTKTEVFPLFVDFKKYNRPMNRFMYELFRDDRTNILFVGRIVPNKKIDDLIRVLFYFKKYISPLVRLIVVGKTSSLPEYYKSLVRIADEFYLKPEEICFTGHIPDDEMFSLYKAADVFLSLSEHEGFGLPFIESMVFDLPIIAYDCTAVPFTLDGAGILIKNKKVDYVAELVDIVVHQKKLRQDIIQGQRQRLERFKNIDKQEILLRVIDRLKK
ncbi:MAG: glycosyltransferase family 4 protein [Candidatus Aminicenantes bacterium]|nr:MAG: glycosyltransferase family 4 protein [Candidatus Aminicenantes bacterium]